MKTKEMMENFRQQKDVKGSTPRSMVDFAKTSGKPNKLGKNTVNKKMVRGK